MKLTAEQLAGVMIALQFGLSNAPWEGICEKPWSELPSEDREQILSRAKAHAEAEVARLNQVGVDPELNQSFLARFGLAAINRAAEVERQQSEQLQKHAQQSGSMRGLRMAVNDLLSNAAHFSNVQRQAIAHRLAVAGLPPLRLLSVKLQRAQSGILKRGKIRSESEYYMVKEIICGPAEDLSKSALVAFERMVGAFEARPS